MRFASFANWRPPPSQFILCIPLCKESRLPCCPCPPRSAHCLWNNEGTKQTKHLLVCLPASSRCSARTARTARQAPSRMPRWYGTALRCAALRMCMCMCAAQRRCDPAPMAHMRSRFAPGICRVRCVLAFTQLGSGAKAGVVDNDAVFPPAGLPNKGE